MALARPVLLCPVPFRLLRDPETIRIRRRSRGGADGADETSGAADGMRPVTARHAELTGARHTAMTAARPVTGGSGAPTVFRDLPRSADPASTAQSGSIRTQARRYANTDVGCHISDWEQKCHLSGVNFAT